MSRDEQRDRLADEFRRPVAKQLFRAGIPTCYDPAKVFADDGILGGCDYRGKLLPVLLCLVAFVDIDKHVDGAGQSSGFIEQWRRIGDEGNPGAVRALSDRFHATDRSLLMQRHRHRTLVVWQWRAVRPIKLPGTAELAVAQFGATTPKRGRSLVVIGDAPLCIRHVDGGRKYLNCLAAQPVDLTCAV